MHLEHWQAARSAHRNKRVSQCEASTSPRHRCYTPLPLCNTLFQRLALLSDTSLVQSAIRQSLLATFSTASKRYTYHRLLSHLAVHSHLSPKGIADCPHRCTLATLNRYVCRRSFPAVGYGNTSCRSERRNKRVLQCEASTLRGKRSGSAAAHRYRFATHSFNGYRCCPIPPFAQTSFGKSFVSSLHSHVASKHRCFGNLTFLVHWLKARNYRCYDER